MLGDGGGDGCDQASVRTARVDRFLHIVFGGYFLHSGV